MGNIAIYICEQEEFRPNLKHTEGFNKQTRSSALQLREQREQAQKTKEPGKFNRAGTKNLWEYCSEKG